MCTSLSMQPKMRSAALRTLESMLRPGDRGVYADETRSVLENADESLNCSQVELIAIMLLRLGIAYLCVVVGDRAAASWCYK